MRRRGRKASCKLLKTIRRAGKWAIITMTKPEKTCYNPSRQAGANVEVLEIRRDRLITRFWLNCRSFFLIPFLAI